MKFATFKDASAYIATLKPLLTDGYKGKLSQVRLFDAIGEIPWLGVNLDAAVDCEWTRLCIDKNAATDGQRESFSVLVEHWPNGSLRAKDAKATYRPLLRVEPMEVVCPTPNG